MPTEVTNVPIVLTSLIGHLEGIAASDADRPLTAYQRQGFNWVLGHARARYSDVRLRAVEPFPEGDEATVAETLERLRALAAVVLEG
jgi:hypothetical protein